MSAVSHPAQTPSARNAVKNAAGDTFATAINCIDGRVQICVIEKIRSRFAVQYVDVITEPGADGILAFGPPEVIEAIRRKAALSVERHRSRVVAIAAHHDCLGNPGSKAEHLECLKRAVERIVGWNLKVRVVGLWVNERWCAEIVSDTEQ